MIVASVFTGLHQAMPTSKIKRSISLLGVLVVSVLLSSSAFAQYGGPAKITIKSSVLGEDRVILVRTPPGYEANKLAGALHDRRRRSHRSYRQYHRIFVKEWPHA